MENFRIASYNILADSLIDPALYPRISGRYLDWNFRKPKLRAECARIAADILCLQEVDDEDFLQTGFAEYEYVWKKRSGDKQDGCVILWRRDLFSVVQSYEYEFNISAFMDRDNIAQCVELRHNSSGCSLLVANTHLLYNPKRGDIKLAQLLSFFQGLEMIRGLRPIPLLISGDFNLTPDSDLYRFISAGKLNTHRWNYRTSSGQQKFHGGGDAPANEFGLGSATVEHGLQLQSVYATVNGHEPACTTWHYDWTGTVDYIWYSSPALSPVSVTMTHSKDVLVRQGGLPNDFRPSDHIPIVCDIQWSTGF